MNQAGFSLRGHNPDVLSCIANLSNDEVFTPPELANQMLDTLASVWAAANQGANIWEDRSVRFLDPFAKSGVFLREIVRRLTDGLAAEIPDLQRRVNHVLKNQVYGIGITRLTSLLTRRTVYCSKDAAGKHSIASEFNEAAGNVWFERVEHSWVGRPSATERRCKFCGASEAEYSRGADLETHAYAFIHTENARDLVAQLFGDGMKFDVVIGNPPYQLGSDGGTRDVPIYQKFVAQAKALEPQYLCMVIPARWMASGLGLTDFRKEMLSEKRIRHLVDFPVAKEVFPNVEVKGGICYFLWDQSYSGDTEVITIRDGVSDGPHMRRLGQFDVFVRDYRAVRILEKVLAKKEASITKILSVDKEFGWTSNFTGFRTQERAGDVPLHYAKHGQRKVGYISRSEVEKSAHLIDKWKVMIPKAGSDGGQRLPDYVLGKPHIAASPSVCTQTFLFFWLSSEAEALSVESYLRTRFFRFLVSLRKITQDATRSTYTWVPQQTWDRVWTDEELYESYGLSADEVSFIESRVRELEQS